MAKAKTNALDRLEKDLEKYRIELASGKLDKGIANSLAKIVNQHINSVKTQLSALKMNASIT